MLHVQRLWRLSGIRSSNELEEVSGNISVQAEVDHKYVQIDNNIVRVRQHSAGVKIVITAEKIGRSGAGLTTKIHATWAR